MLDLQNFIVCTNQNSAKFSNLLPVLDATKGAPGIQPVTCDRRIDLIGTVLESLDCPRSGPGPVRALFADPGPGPQVQVQSFSDLDLDLYWTWTWCPVQVRSRSGPGHEYCSVLINNN